MFEYIIGDVVAIQEDYIVLQNNGIGYKIFTSINSMLKLDMGNKDVVVYTYFVVREDGVFLYGFTSEEEMNMFKLLLMVSKVGPKIALGVLSTLKPNQIKLGVLRKDIELLCKAPGIGKKTAERIILELKDRIDKDTIVEDYETGEIIADEYGEAVEALVSLGYTKLEVERAISSMDVKGKSVEDIIKMALRKLSKA